MLITTNERKRILRRTETTRGASCQTACEGFRDAATEEAWATKALTTAVKVDLTTTTKARSKRTAELSKKMGFF